MNNTTLHPYLQTIREYSLLSYEDKLTLVKEVRNGSEQAAEQLVTSHLRLVVSIAKHYQHRGLPLADLINEGNIGLINAIKRFDETRGSNFSAYAGQVIKRQIVQALAEQSNVVRIPMKQILTLRKQQRKLQDLSNQLQHHNASSETIGYIEKQIEAIQYKLNASSRASSIDVPLASSDNTLTSIDFITADEEKQPEALVVQNMSRHFVYQALTTLNERERRILDLYYGLYEQEPKTLQEIGNLFGITRERVRQIKLHALEKLRRTLHAQN